MGSSEESDDTKVILDFCGYCGVVLPAGLGNEPEPQCPNCNASVKETEQRVQGLFTKKGAGILHNPPAFAPDNDEPDEETSQD